jgi:aralkylamine N-acetyltransferase
MNIHLSTDIANVSWVELTRLFELAPSGKKRDPDRLEIAFRNSLLKVFAYHDRRLVGAGRALSDGAWRAVILDVAVLPEYQDSLKRRACGARLREPGPVHSPAPSKGQRRVHAMACFFSLRTK